MVLMKSKWIKTFKFLEQKAWHTVTLYGVLTHIVLQNSAPQTHLFTTELQREIGFIKYASY